MDREQLIDDMIAEDNQVTIKDYLELRNELEAISKSSDKIRVQKLIDDANNHAKQAIDRLREVYTEDITPVTDNELGVRVAVIRRTPQAEAKTISQTHCLDIA